MWRSIPDLFINIWPCGPHAPYGPSQQLNTVWESVGTIKSLQTQEPRLCQNTSLTAVYPPTRIGTESNVSKCTQVVYACARGISLVLYSYQLVYKLEYKNKIITTGRFHPPGGDVRAWCSWQIDGYRWNLLSEIQQQVPSMILIILLVWWPSDMTLWYYVLY